MLPGGRLKKRVRPRSTTPRPLKRLSLTDVPKPWRPSLFSTPGGGWPQELNLHLRYVGTSGQQSIPSGTAIQRVWRTNSMYDVDFTGVGLYPEGFVSFSAIYSKYYVKKAVVWAQFMITSAANTSTMAHCICYPDLLSATAGTYATSQMKNPAHTKDIHQMDTWVTPKFTIYPHLQAGLNWRDDVLCAGVGSNPSTQTFLHTDMWVDPATSAECVVTFYGEFDVTMFAQTVVS